MTGWLLVSGDFKLHGGMDRANLELAQTLAVDSKVHLVTHRADDYLAAKTNVTVHRVPRPLGRHLLGQPLLARAGRRKAKQLAPDGYRVVVNGGNCRWPDVNWVHYVHAAVPPHSATGKLRTTVAGIKRSVALRDERISLTQARLAICNSRRTAADIVERVGVDPQRVRVIYLGVDPSQFGTLSLGVRSDFRRQLKWDDRPWVAFVGALGDSRKGFDILYEAWRELCHDPQWDANLAVVGSGSSLSSWQSRATTDKLEGRIHFLGFRTDVPTILAASDLMVHPARYEPYGMAPHEALCRGVPAIVSAAAGISERYPSDLADLMLANPEDTDELVDRLRFWRTNVDSFAARVRPFGDELRSRSWADMARDMRDLILKT